MPINQIETNLEALTNTIAYIEKNGGNPDTLKELKEERNRLLTELNVF
ncbi:hypothetical protein [Methanobacterium paludis]|uniref:Uncharacterized protein n=1 Tax=Methanobacterium paludis (strain DSM 25820 / JCM 18151 / SWAN1) TaxID=868131 RepID=F6D3I7_METPW|nr:hypothetical protein [Methanobacterium paludis]AEG19163.1 hypothetical protein MSWAN_2155 [Methanobacterium paludis]